VRPRFYLPSVDASGRGQLDDEEAGHLTRVLRLGAGTEIDVFDGRGRMYRARVVEAGRRGVSVDVLELTTAAPEAALQVTLVMSVLKGDKMDAVVRDAVMMGAVAIQPIVAARSEVTLTALQRGLRAERWQRIAVASVKQCGRAVVPVIHAPVEVTTWSADPRDRPVLVLMEPAGHAAAALHEIPRASALDLAVGPEGGWSAEEAGEFASRGFRFVSLGRRTLRADAAPVVAMAALYAGWNAW
jgi:16S rRNA (uracil1498-N3)-methyltransferase